MQSGPAAFIGFMKHPVKSRMFLLSKLPSAYFSGVRVKEIDEEYCAVTIPYKWFSKNPFRSTYFACLSMAAEMSTGALAMTHLYQLKPTVSMLVIKVESEYFKKAIGVTTFTCTEGLLIKKTIETAIASRQPQTVKVMSTGKNNKGEKVAEFFITWSFKVKDR